MAGGKETPRQKMIGMMYLVLTALLALNVSDQVLDAFKLVRTGLEATTVNFSGKNEFTYGAFEAALKNNPNKTKPFYDKAMQAQKISKDLYTYIDNLKATLIERGGGISEDNDDIANRKDLDISAEIMITKGEGPKLKAKVLDARKQFLSLVDPKDQKDINFALDAQDPKPGKDGLARSWESLQFENVPLTAAVTLMSKLQNDVKNAEADVINYLYKSIDAQDFKFDQLNAVVVAPTSYVLQGQPYEADVFLTASSSTQSPDIYVGGTKLRMEDGKGKYTVSTSREGMFTWGGVIKVKAPDGTIKEYKTEEQTYQVAKPTAVVSADKMNVLYIGVDNPLSVSAPGIPKEKLRASITGGGSLSGSNGKYIARVTAPGKATITVSGEIQKGQYKPLGSMEYRVKRVPDPVAKVAGMASGSLAASVLKAQRGVFAVLDNFDFDLKFTVTKFTLTVIRARQDPVQLKADGPALSQEMINALGGVSSKDKVFFDDIYAKGPDGTNRRLNGVVISVQ